MWGSSFCAHIQVAVTANAVNTIEKNRTHRFGIASLLNPHSIPESRIRHYLMLRRSRPHLCRGKLAFAEFVACLAQCSEDRRPILEFGGKDFFHHAARQLWNK